MLLNITNKIDGVGSVRCVEIIMRQRMILTMMTPFFVKEMVVMVSLCQFKDNQGRYNMNESASIASPHWEACESCVNFTPYEGCTCDEIDLALYMGDFILCKQFKNREV